MVFEGKRVGGRLNDGAKGVQETRERIGREEGGLLDEGEEVEFKLEREILAEEGREAEVEERGGRVIEGGQPVQTGAAAVVVIVNQRLPFDGGQGFQGLLRHMCS